MLKHIPQSWKDDLRTNFAHKHDFYINPRGRVLPALTSAGISYIKNDATTNMRGTYRMQTGASTDLKYLYTLPQRFIIEGWFKPEFAYDVGSNQLIFDALSGTTGIRLYYSQAADLIQMLTYVSGTGNGINTTAFTATADLQKWIYLRCYFDNLAKLKGFYCTVNGVAYANTQNVPGAGDFIPPNTISFMPTVAAESSYWIIHELDEALPTGEYKTYQADRQIIFDFNGTALGRERIRIPTIHSAADTRGVVSFNISKSVEDPMTGSAGANTAGLKLLNVNGSFSDDQYDAFDPFNGRYNGTQKYLQNRVPVEIESTYSRNGGTSDIPNGTPIALYGATESDAWTGWTVSGAGTTIAITKGNAITTSTGAASIRIISPTITGIHNAKIRLRVSASDVSAITAMGAQLSSAPFTVFSPDYLSKIQAAGDNVFVYHDMTISDATAVNRFMLYINTTGAQVVTVDWLYVGDLSELTDPMSEPLFIGRTTPGAFTRSSPNKFYGDVTIKAEDGISELGETKLRKAYGFDSYALCDPAAENDSLVHSIARLVTKKEIRNYALNSSFENATIANSWANVNLSAMTRDSTYAQFGTYSAKCVATGLQYFTQNISFTGTDKIDVGDTFNFSVYIRQGVTENTYLRIWETTGVDATIAGTDMTSTVKTAIDIFERHDVSITITDPTCVGLLLVVIAAASDTFYADGVMLTRGIDPIDYFLPNANDGTSGAGSADDAATTTYDTVAFDCDAVDVEHPYALVEKGQTTWDALKKINDASIGAYMGNTPDGVFRFAVRYNGDDMPNMGDIEDFGGIATSLDVAGANSIKAHGVIIVKETATKQLWTAEGSSVFETDEGGKMLHPIANAAYMSVSGATDIEMKYSEDM